MAQPAAVGGHPERSEGSAVVLADEDQLEALARLRIEPRDTDEVGALVAKHNNGWTRRFDKPLEL